MNKTPFPADYQQVMPYLLLRKPEAFLRFAKEVLGAREKIILRGEDGGWKHCEVTIGASVIMFSESMAQFPPQPAGLFVYVTDADSAYETAIRLGAEGVMPVSDQPYGRSGGVKDENGNTWWLTTA